MTGLCLSFWVFGSGQSRLRPYLHWQSLLSFHWRRHLLTRASRSVHPCAQPDSIAEFLGHRARSAPLCTARILLGPFYVPPASHCLCAASWYLALPFIQPAAPTARWHILLEFLLVNILALTSSQTSTPTAEAEGVSELKKKSFTDRYKRRDRLNIDELVQYFQLVPEDFDTCDPIEW